MSKTRKTVSELKGRRKMGETPKTLAEFQAELNARFTKLEDELKKLQSGFGDLKGLYQADHERLYSLVDVMGRPIKPLE